MLLPRRLDDDPAFILCAAALSVSSDRGSLAQGLPEEAR